MPQQYCFLCASDEGILLDITADNKQVFHEQFEICALVKVQESDQLPSKICHKCAYELNQCSCFVKKYKLAAIQKANGHGRCCSLCLEPAKSEYIFDFSKDKRFQLNTLDEIHKLFNHELAKSHMDHKLICLSCRYTVDVLLDLKNIYMETSDRLKSIIKEEIDYLTFPKINATVVSRKTTVTASARINLSGEVKSNSNKMTRTRSQSGKLNSDKSNSKMKPQVCVKCHNPIGAGHMYKVHKTKDIVCKSCWKNMDIHTSDSDSHVQNNATETKLCTVFLTDVLKDADEQEKSLYRIDEDDQGNKIYVITDQSLPNITKHDKLPNSAQPSSRSRQRQKRSLRSINSENGEINDKDVLSKKQKSDTIQTSDTESKVSESLTQKLKTMKPKSGVHNIRQGSDSDSSTKTSAKRSERTLTRYKRATGSSLSDADVDNKRNRKRLSTILKGVTTLKTVDARDKSPMTDYVGSRRKRIRLTSVPPIMEQFYNKAQCPPERIVRKARSSQRRVKSGSTVKVSQESLSSEYDEKEVIFETETYVCDECGASYENKLLGLTHKLRHYKQPKLKLQKLCRGDLVTEILGSSRTVNDDQSEGLSEATAISLNDVQQDNAEEQAKNLPERVKISIDDDKVDPEEESHSLNRNNSYIDDDLDTESKVWSPKIEVAVEDAVDVELVMKDFDDDLSQKTEKGLEEDGETQTSFSNWMEEKANEITKCKLSQERHKNNCNDEADKSIDKFVEGGRVNGIEKQDIVHNDDKDMEKYDEGNKEKDRQEKNESKIDKEEKAEGDIAKSKEEKDDGVVRNSTEDNDKNERVCIEQEVEGTSNEYLDVCRISIEQKTLNRDEVDSSRETNANEIKNLEAVEKVDKVLIEFNDVKTTDSKCTKVGDVRETVKKLIDADDTKIMDRELTDVGDVKEMSKVESSEYKEEITATDENKPPTNVNCTDSNKMEVAKHTVLSQEGNIVGQGDISAGDIETSESDVYKRSQATCDPANVAAKVLQEVLDLASAEVQKRQKFVDKNIENDTIESETLENISREIQNTVDMPKIDDINSEADIHL